jgi:hypothetical protein
MCICSELLFSLKKRKMLLFLTTGISLGDSIVSEISQTQEEKMLYYFLPVRSKKIKTNTERA